MLIAASHANIYRCGQMDVVSMDNKDPSLSIDLKKKIQM